MNLVNENIFLLIAQYWLHFSIAITISYLLGGINFSIIITRLFGEKKDIRTLGSGNAGFTNTLRSVGKTEAIFTFIGDFLKGILSVWITKLIFSHIPAFQSNYIYIQIIAFISGFACVLGHMYPCFLKFKGGKGILTTWAISFLIDLRISVLLITIFLIVLIYKKIVSLASIVCAISYPFIILFVAWDGYRIYKNSICFWLMTILGLAWGIIVLIRHKKNILKLLSGEEKKISVKK